MLATGLMGLGLGYQDMSGHCVLFPVRSALRTRFFSAWPTMVVPARSPRQLIMVIPHVVEGVDAGYQAHNLQRESK